MGEQKNKHTSYDLAQMQSLPLEQKVIMTQRRIQEWYDYWDGQVMFHLVEAKIALYF